MSLFNLLIIEVSLVLLFLFSIWKFSKQIHYAASDRFKNLLARATSNPIRGTILGALFTSLIQSSTATTVIVVSLVDAGLLSFTNSLGVIFGANIGTTITSQLIALKVTYLSPYFVILGFLLMQVKEYRAWGKTVFYFGLVFLSLFLITNFIEPIKDYPGVIDLFSKLTNIYWAILAGAVFTVMIQASAVTSGLAILLVAGGLLNFEQALGIVLGANLGTTSTSLLASLTMNASAKKAAIAHFLFNLIGIFLVLPFVNQFSNFVVALGGSPSQQIANAHILFNVMSAVVFLIFIKPFARFINSLI